MKNNDELINFMKQNKDSILNGSKNLKWQGLNKQQVSEINKIPKRYKRYLFIKSSIAASIVFLFISVSMSSYYFYYHQPKQQLAEKKTEWNYNGYELYDEFEDSQNTTQTGNTQTDSVSNELVTIDQELIDIDSQLQWIAQPLWQTTS